MPKIKIPKALKPTQRNFIARRCVDPVKQLFGAKGIKQIRSIGIEINGGNRISLMGDPIRAKEFNGYAVVEERYETALLCKRVGIHKGPVYKQDYKSTWSCGPSVEVSRRDTVQPRSVGLTQVGWQVEFHYHSSKHGSLTPNQTIIVAMVELGVHEAFEELAAREHGRRVLTMEEASNIDRYDWACEGWAGLPREERPRMCFQHPLWPHDGDNYFEVFMRFVDQENSLQLGSICF